MTIPTSLAQMAALIESANDPGAIRFEPEMYARWSSALDVDQLAVLARIVHANQCSRATALMIACTSWGAYQIMGENLYASGSPSVLYSVAEILSSMTIQSGYFWWFVNTKHINYTLDELKTDPAKREHYAEVYNGPGNVVAYADRVTKILGV